MKGAVVRVVDVHLMRWEGDTPYYLLLQRAAGQIYEHVWQGVTGKIKAGEAAWQTALREVNEETGLKPLKMWTVDRVNFFYEAEHDRMNSIPVFGMELSGDRITLSPEHQAHAWYLIEEAAQRLLWEQQRQGLLAFHDMLTVATDKLRWTAIDVDGHP